MDSELDSWNVDESSVVYPVLKQEESNIEIVLQETLRESSRKRKRVSSFKILGE